VRRCILRKFHDDEGVVVAIRARQVMSGPAAANYCDNFRPELE
jgi:hypothetical protein